MVTTASHWACCYHRCHVSVTRAVRQEDAPMWSSIGPTFYIPSSLRGVTNYDAARNDVTVQCKQRQPRITVLLYKPQDKLPALYDTRKFVTSFTTAHHLSPSWSILIQCRSSHTIQSAAERTPLFEKRMNSKSKKIRQMFFYFWKEQRMPFYINVFWTKHHSSGGLEYWYTDVASLGSCWWPWESFQV